jgi:hypothetical protein
MNLTRTIRNSICVTGCVVMGFIAIPEVQSQDASIEEKTHIHRLASTKRAKYDAFTYVNRLPEAPDANETPLQLAGRLFGRLANQEGRMLLKLPTGMTKDDYLSFKKFFRYEGEQVGNCAACHVPGEFDSKATFVTSKGGTSKAAPSLRNLAKRDVDVAAVIKAKIEAAKLKQSGKADDIDDAYSPINITEDDVAGLVTFLKLLNDGKEEDFRELILNAEIIDTSDVMPF